MQFVEKELNKIGTAIKQDTYLEAIYYCMNK